MWKLYHIKNDLASFLCRFLKKIQKKFIRNWKKEKNGKNAKKGSEIFVISYQENSLKKISKKIWRQIPESPWQTLAVSKVRIIDFDIEESSNWNETCLNNSLNVSFLAFQITCTVKPDFFLLAGSQRTFCVQGACERRKRKPVNLPLSGWLLGLDSRLT